MLWTTRLGSLADDGDELGPGLKVSLVSESINGDTGESIRVTGERVVGGVECRVVEAFKLNHL